MLGKMPSTRPELLERVKRALTKPASQWRLEENVAWQEFEQRYRAFLMRKASRSNLGPEDCEDLVQEVLIAVRRALPDFVYDPARGPFGGWLMKIATNALKDEYRKRGRSLPTEQPPSSVVHLGGVDQCAVAPEEAAIASEQMTAFFESLRELESESSQAHYSLFFEVKVRGRTCADVAREMGIAQATARKIVERLLKQLKEIARRNGLDG